jgi:hypothetical protein
VGRASNRKKARRRGDQDAPRTSRAHAEALDTASLAFLLAGAEAMNREAREREVAREAAIVDWCGGSDPSPADLPDWPAGSLGERFFASREIEDARTAPSVRTADIPPGMVITEDPAHWRVAMHCLIRAVVFDGLTPDDPPVSRLMRILVPIAAEELAYGAAMEEWNFSGALGGDEPPEFPELDGPVFLLGASALVDAFGAVLGDDELEPVRQVLQAPLDETVPGIPGGVLADALIGAFGTHFSFQLAEDREGLAQLSKSRGNPLVDLVTGGAVTRAAVLPVGLRLLAALTALCQSDADSLPQARGRDGDPHRVGDVEHPFVVTD